MRKKNFILPQLIFSLVQLKLGAKNARAIDSALKRPINTWQKYKKGTIELAKKDIEILRVKFPKFYALTKLPIWILLENKQTQKSIKYYFKFYSGIIFNKEAIPFVTRITNHETGKLIYQLQKLDESKIKNISHSPAHIAFHTVCFLIMLSRFQSNFLSDNTPRQALFSYDVLVRSFINRFYRYIYIPGKTTEYISVFFKNIINALTDNAPAHTSYAEKAREVLLSQVMFYDIEKEFLLRHKIERALRKANRLPKKYLERTVIVSRWRFGTPTMQKRKANQIYTEKFILSKFENVEKDIKNFYSRKK